MLKVLTWHAKDHAMYNLIEYSGNYSKTLEVYSITTEMNHF